MIWGFWLAVSCFCALNTPQASGGKGYVWVGGFADKPRCEEVRKVTAPTARCEHRYEGDMAR